MRSLKHQVRYELLPGGTIEEPKDLSLPWQMAEGPSPWRRHRDRLLQLLLVVLILTAGLLYALSLPSEPINSASLLPHCRTIEIRKEWRDLSLPEQQRYIEAVQCLSTQPSRAGLNQSLYDDFPHIHSEIGNSSHNSNIFLPWHRVLLRIYEQALREQCGYSGQLVYWDWSRDWTDITASPIWSDYPGFGGDGNHSDAKSVAFGHCVTDGSFANRSVLWYGNDYQPHCLSRGFQQDTAKRHELEVSVRPAAIDEILQVSDYVTFWDRLEHGPHNAIPQIVRGDFYRVTAPNDPVFFLHHVQLDRLWWLWQQQDPDRRHRTHPSGDEYQKSGVPADVTMEFGSLMGHSVQMKDTLKTDTPPYCYRY